MLVLIVFVDCGVARRSVFLRVVKWFAGELAYLTKRLAETPEPGANGSLLDNTTIVWTNELGKGNSHTLNNIPFVLIGNGMGFRMGRSLDLKGTAHNRLMISLAHAVGHNIEYFGNKKVDYIALERFKV